MKQYKIYISLVRNVSYITTRHLSLIRTKEHTMPNSRTILEEFQLLFYLVPILIISDNNFEKRLIF